MIASRLIDEDILALSSSDSIGEALSRMNEYKVSHFPVVNGEQFLGLISEKDIEDFENHDVELKKEFIHFDKHYVNVQQYIYDILKMAYTQKLTIVPVVDDDGRYIGCITQRDIVNFFSETMSVDYPGGVIVLELSINDYSLTEIANIVETNDAKVLSSHIVSEVNSTKIEVIIKVSKINIGPILQTFERFGYKVVASFQESINYDELKDNYDSLINYLKI
ncbi:MAG: CBS domain-containing protein [Bacteroidetes bacterium]|nr:CBS domain-containing protein [Bacteroidota bacterium]